MSKHPEQIRLVLDIIRSTLAPLTEAERTTVLVELAIVEATELNATRKLLDEAREHSDQRLEEVYAARALLGAWPHETLPSAILRWRCVTPPMHVPPCTRCTKKEPCSLHVSGIHDKVPGTSGDAK